MELLGGKLHHFGGVYVAKIPQREQGGVEPPELTASFPASPMQALVVCILHSPTVGGSSLLIGPDCSTKGKGGSQTHKSLFASSPSPRLSFLFCGFHALVTYAALPRFALSAPNKHFVGFRRSYPRLFALFRLRYANEKYQPPA